MDIAINDISFMYKLKSLNEAKEALMNLEQITTYLKSESVTKVRYIINDQAKINQATMLTDTCNLIVTLKSISDREIRGRLLQLLVNSNIVTLDNVPAVKIGDFESKLCFCFKDSFIVSFNSHDIFEKENVAALYGEEILTIRNISKMEHTNIYRAELGIRKYENNPKHVNKTYVRAGGESVSAMPLSDEVAQKVLNRAVEINGKLYGMWEEDYYEFPCTVDNVFHGFQNKNLDVHMQRKIRREVEQQK